MPGKPHYEPGRNQWTLKIGGRRKYLCSGSDNEALAWKKAGELTGGQGPLERPRTVVQAVDQWLRTRGTKEHEWYLKPFMQWAVGVSLDAIHDGFLEDYLTHLSRARYTRKVGKRILHRSYSASTIRRQMRFARTVLVWAHRRGLTEHPAPPLPPLPRRTEVDRSIPSGVLSRLLEELPDGCRTVITFMVLTGCRPDEACRLTWTEVKDGYCELRRGKTWQRTGQARVIPLTPEARQVLAEQSRSGRYVFVNGNGTPYRPNGLRSILRRAGTRIGHPISGTYQLRHTWAMHAVDSLSLDVVGAALGHQPGSSETRVYARLSRARVQREVQSLAPVVPVDLPRPDSPSGGGSGTSRAAGPRSRGKTARDRKGRAAPHAAARSSDTDARSSR